MSKLVSDGSVAAANTDVSLKNPWGIVFGPNLPVWVANNGTDTSTIYEGTGLVQALIVHLRSTVELVAASLDAPENGAERALPELALLLPSR